jgi:glycosyltransferase involved in cell wall biosynthesis
LRRILHLTIHLDGGGGAENQLIRNVEAMDSSRFESLLCCVEKPRDLALKAAEKGIPVFSLGAYGKPHWPRAIYRLCRLVRSQKIDLIHTSLFEADVIGGIAGRLCGVPVVSTLCNIGGEPERLVDNPGVNKLKLAVTTKWWGMTLRSCHQSCIAISNAVKESAIATYGVSGSKIAVIYRSVDPAWSAAGVAGKAKGVRQELRLDDAYPILLNVARFYPQKGQRYLLQAMPEVIRQFPSAHLLMAGEGPLREYLTSLARELGIEANVTFLGRRNDVRSLLELCDIFVFPSLYEGLGGALVEATSACRPCVASRVGPIPEVVEDGRSGVLVPSQSPEALAQAIIKLGNDRDLARAMGQRGHQVAAEKFSIDRNVKHLEEVYDQILGTEKAYSDATSPS